MTLSLPQPVMTNGITKGTHSLGKSVIQLLFFCLFGKGSYFPSVTPYPSWSSRETVIKSSPFNQGYYIEPVFPEKKLQNTKII